jgi:glycerophosphoryl diester phosphodiesterase
MNHRFHRLLPLSLILISFFISCASHNPRRETTNIVLPASFQVIGHRGTRDFAPENTMTAFRMAAKLGTAFELDTMFCKSGELVVIHDYSVDRTTNQKGKVSDLTLSELKKLDAGSFFLPKLKQNLEKWSIEEIRKSAKNGLLFSAKFKGNIDKLTKEQVLALDSSNFLYDKFKGETIPTLEEVFDEFGGKTLVDVEIKSEKTGEPARLLGQAVAELITKKKLETKVFISSFNPYVLESVKHTNPAIIRGQLYSEFKDEPMNYFVKVLLRNLYFNDKAEPDILAMEKGMVNSDYVKEMHNHGYKLYPWTVNDPTEIEKLIQNGVDGIISDRPDLVKELYRVSKEKQVSFSGN